MKLVPLFNLRARVDAPIEVGKVVAGTRRIYNVLGGEFEGERLRGKVLPGGGEWFLHGDASLGQVDVRILLETDGGVPIYMRYSGLMDFNEKIIAALSEGRPSDFGDNLFLTQVRFETGDPAYEWLANSIAVGEGRVHPDSVEYAIFQATHG